MEAEDLGRKWGSKQRDVQNMDTADALRGVATAKPPPSHHQATTKPPVASASLSYDSWERGDWVKAPAGSSKGSLAI